MLAWCGFAPIEEPLPDAIDENDVRQRRDRPVVPEMNARYGRRFQAAQVVKRRMALNRVSRQQVEQPVERDGGDVPIGLPHAPFAQLQCLNFTPICPQRPCGSA